ncbi:MAG: hypothetical protein PVG39_00570 [Desulfobacteraceae bacterium]|jgi:hypothetical protein
MKKCPECGIRHIKLDKAEICFNKVGNKYGHYIILCSPEKAGVKTLKEKYNNTVGIKYFKFLRRRFKKMERYLKEEFNYVRY